VVRELPWVREPAVPTHLGCGIRTRHRTPEGGLVNLKDYERAWILATLIVIALTVTFVGCGLAWHAWGN